ncbi:MAG: DUF433 domain-containing protein [Bacillota bacterium]
MYLDRIETTPGVLHGKARIKGTRIAVYMILEMLAGGYSNEDIKACLEYAALAAREEVYSLEANS